MKKPIKVKFVAADFRGNSYMSQTDCPCVRAVKRATGATRATADGLTVTVNRKTFVIPSATADFLAANWYSITRTWKRLPNPGEIDFKLEA